MDNCVIGKPELLTVLANYPTTKSKQEGSNMLRILINNWWLLALRGVFALLFAALAFSSHTVMGTWLLSAIALAGVVVFFGLLAIAAGVCTIVAGVRGAGEEKWWLLFWDGVAVCIFGAVVLLAPELDLIWLARMLAVCAAGRILNPKSARSQVIGAMTMGAGAALMEEMVVDKRLGFFVNHDLAGYEVPVHADIPHQEVIFLDEVDPTISPMKAKGVGELGLCGVAAAIANAVYNATGVRVREYPITLDKFLDRLPDIA